MTELTFEEYKARLDEIADAVASPDIDLDEALSLYEEAVKISLHACDVSEADVMEFQAVEEPPQEGVEYALVADGSETEDEPE